MKIAAVGDLHVGVEPGRSLRGLFAEISEQADALALCGDLTNLGKPEEAAALATDLREACRVPVVGVLGNHDWESGQPEDVAQVLASAGVHFLEHGCLELDGVGFAGVKGFAGGFEQRMLSPFGEGEIKQFVEAAVAEATLLEQYLRSLTSERIAVVLHYAPIAATVEGEPRELYPFLGCSRLAETIDRFGVDAVMHGHAHYGTHAGQTPKGAPVFNCAQHVLRTELGREYALLEI